MALTDVELCKQALLVLGAKEIQSFSDGTDRATLCANLYPEKKEYMLTTHKWNFARAKKKLAQKTSAPLSEYDNAFSLPSQMLAGPHSVFVDSDAKGTIQEWDIFGSDLYTDHSEIWIDYTKDVDENDFPPYFVELMKYAMAEELAKAVTDETTTQRSLYDKVYGTAGDNTDGGLLGKAKRLDAFSRPTQIIQDDPLTEARFAR